MTNTSEPSEFWVKAKDIVADAADVASADRAAWVRARCAGDEKLLAEVSSLLSGLTGIDSYIEEPVFAQWTETLAPDLQGGVRLGAYALDHEVGRGGMGVVWAAHRVDGAYEQRVAIKLLIGSHSPRDVRRLERERQWLAQLNHPGIARLLDGGTSPNGTPYLVLEFVEGQSIDQYCTQTGLSVAQRVALVRQVCAAVQSAHQSALIHRDIKPSNILVTAAGETKLLDFGIARLLAEEGAGSDVTLANALPFTPRYASPEQLRGAPVTVATDVHGLGLLLYELLCGASPYRRLDANRDSNLADAVLALSQDDPRAPSTVAQGQGMGAAHVRALRGELDAVLLKACAKTPEARYATVAQLDEDLRRWLDGDAVLARQPTRLHIAAKLLRKHWVASALGAGALVLVVAGLVVSVWQWQRSEQALQMAQTRLETVRGFNRAVLDSVGTRLSGLPGGLAVKQGILTKVLASMNSVAPQAQDDLEFLGDLAIAYERIAEMQGNETGLSLGEGAEAQRNAELAITYAQRAWPVKQHSLEFVQAYANMHTVRALQARAEGRLEEAVTALKSAQEILETGLLRHPGHERLQAPLAQSWMYMGQVLDGALTRPSFMQPNAALPWHDRAQQLFEAIYSRNPLPALLHEMSTVHGARSRSQSKQGRWQAACASAERAVDLLERELAADGGLSARSALAVELVNAADCEVKRGNFTVAEALMVRSFSQYDEMIREPEGAEKWRRNQRLAGAVLARTRLAQGKLTDVERLLRAALAELPPVTDSSATHWTRRGRSIGRALVLADLANAAARGRRQFVELPLAMVALEEVRKIADEQPQLTEAWSVRVRLELALALLGKADGDVDISIGTHLESACRALGRLAGLRPLDFEEAAARKARCG